MRQALRDRVHLAAEKAREQSRKPSAPTLWTQAISEPRSRSLLSFLIEWFRDPSLPEFKRQWQKAKRDAKRRAAARARDRQRMLEARTTVCEEVAPVYRSQTVTVLSKRGVQTVAAKRVRAHKRQRKVARKSGAPIRTYFAPKPINKVRPRSTVKVGTPERPLEKYEANYFKALISDLGLKPTAKWFRKSRIWWNREFEKFYARIVTDTRSGATMLVYGYDLETLAQMVFHVRSTKAVV